MNLFESIKSGSLIKESNIKVGDSFKNKEGAIIKVVEPTKEGRPQFNIASSKEDFTNGKVECRDTDSYETLDKILSDNGYEAFKETEEPETYEAVEEEIEKIRKQLDYCERRDAVCATFGAEQERAELEARLVELSEKLDTWDGDKFVSECSLKESTRTFKLGDTVYWVGAGNEISATGEIVDFPTEGRMTVKWDDGDVNTYDTNHPDIQHENDYDNSINETDKAEELTEGTNLRGSVYTEIVRAIDDACSEEMDTEEIRKFLQDLMGYIRGTAESYDVMVESTAVIDEGYAFSSEVRAILDAYTGETTEDYTKALNEISKLENDNVISKEEYDAAIAYIQESLKLRESEYSTFFEAANPDNAEANDLIKKALGDAKFAYDHQDELKDLGITVEYSIWRDENEPKNADSFSKCTLVGANGRRLKCNTNAWTSGQMPDSRDITRGYDDYYDSTNENTVAQKSYKDSKEAVKNAKAELPTLKRRLNLYERRYGKDSTQYRELVKYIEDTKKTIDKGIQSHRKTDYNQRPNENVDFKNYLDQKKVSDREKPYEAPKVNPTVAAYKDAKFEEKYNKDWEARNKQYDDEDAQRIADMAKRAAEEKSRRDAQLSDAKARTKATLDELRARVDASKARRGVK